MNVKDCWYELIRCVARGSAAVPETTLTLLLSPPAASIIKTFHYMGFEMVTPGSPRVPARPELVFMVYTLDSSSSSSSDEEWAASQRLPSPTQHTTTLLLLLLLNPSSSLPSTQKGLFFSSFPLFICKLVFFKGLSWPLRFTWHLAWVVGRFTRFVVPSSRVLCDLRGEWSFTMKVSISLLRTDSFFFFFLRTKASRITSNVCRVFQRTFLGLVLSKTQDKFCLCLPRCNALFLVTPPTCVTNSSFQQMQRSISLLNFPQMVFPPFSSPHLCQRLHGNPGVHCQPR